MRNKGLHESMHITELKKIIVAAATAVFLLAGCGVSTTVQPGNTGNLPVINDFSADPAMVQPGSGTQISWRVTNAASVTIDNGIGTVALSGTTTVYPRGNTFYRLTATNAAGSNSAQVTITLAGQGPAVVPASTGPNIPTAPSPSSAIYYQPVVTNFYATPSTLQRGRTATLRWVVKGAEAISIDNGVGSVSYNGAYNVSPQVNTTYNLTAASRNGTAKASVTITVTGTVNAYPAIRWFAANPASIGTGGSTVLNWSVTNARNVSISGVGPVAASGTKKVFPGGSTVYTLSASNSSGTSQATCTVKVLDMNSTTYYQTYQVNAEDPPALILDAGADGSPQGENDYDD